MLQPETVLTQILNKLAVGQTPTAWEWQQLVAEALADERRAKAFGITSANVEKVIQERATIFSSVDPDSLIQFPGFSNEV